MEAHHRKTLLFFSVIYWKILINTLDASSLADSNLLSSSENVLKENIIIPSTPEDLYNLSPGEYQSFITFIPDTNSLIYPIISSVFSSVYLFYGDQTISESQKTKPWAEHDKGLSAYAISLRLSTCSSLIQGHLLNYYSDYNAYAHFYKSKMGMRLDDLVLLVTHSMWVACYYNLKDSDISTLKNLEKNISNIGIDISNQVRILSRTTETPLRFSTQQSKIISQLAKNQNASFNMTIQEGRNLFESTVIMTEILFMFATIFMVFLVFYSCVFLFKNFKVLPLNSNLQKSN